MRVDAHQHYWQIGRNGHEWPTPDLPAIHRDFLPADLAPELASLGIARTVAVQSQPADADTDWLLDLAAQEPSIGAVVGWCDVRAPDAPARIAALAARPKLRGLRPMLQNLPPGCDRLHRAQLDDKDNPYNSYQHEGLPPGPIANPGKRSIEATLVPDGSEYLYFVAKNDREHVFSKTFDEHKKNVDKYQR